MNDEVKELKEVFSIVRPICQTCWDMGLRPITRNALKMAGQKRQKKSKP
jgi:hypothetical protein